MARLLMIGELVDYSSAPKLHYSATKGFHLAEALAAHAEVDYLTTGSTLQVGPVTLRSITELPPLQTYAVVVLMRETNLIEVVTDVPGLLELLLDGERTICVVARGDSFAWMARRELRRRYRSITGRSFIRDASTMFDLVCAQTPELADWSLEALPWRLRRALRDRVLLSPMGVPPINHRLTRPPHVLAAPGEPVELLYMGRLKTDGGRVIAFLCDVMAELGSGYVLHVYPGSFVLPGAPGVVHRPSDPTALALLRQQFVAPDNIVVHPPFDERRKVDVVTRYSIGLDVSPSRPHDRRYRAGNAKLLEYCWLGLAVVTEQNVHNSGLVEECMNGVRLPGVPSPAEYAEAVRQVADCVAAGSYDPTAIAQRTIDLHAWPMIAAPLATACTRPHTRQTGRTALPVTEPPRRTRQGGSTTTKQDVPLCP